MAMTMRELAKLANVSVSTVSKAFCDSDYVHEDTKNHIFELAKKYGCYGKYYKGKYSKKIIAIICSELGSNYYTVFVEQLQKILSANDCISLISTDDFNPAKQAELIEYYASYLKVDGIIVFSLYECLKKGYDTPIVSLLSTADSSVDTVNINFEALISEAVSTLIDLGHREIAFLGEELTTYKEHIFMKTANELGLSSCPVYKSKLRFENAGADGVSQLLSDNTSCTAIICAYDNIAYGAIKELKKRNLQVPKDFSIIGMDNINTSQHMETSLSSIDTNPAEVCMIAWDLLNKKMKNRFYKSNQQISIGGHVILRESVAKREE